MFRHMSAPAPAYTPARVRAVIDPLVRFHLALRLLRVEASAGLCRQTRLAARRAAGVVRGLAESLGPVGASGDRAQAPLHLQTLRSTGGKAEAALWAASGTPLQSPLVLAHRRVGARRRYPHTHHRRLLRRHVGRGRRRASGDDGVTHGWPYFLPRPVVEVFLVLVAPELLVSLSVTRGLTPISPVTDSPASSRSASRSWSSNCS